MSYKCVVCKDTFLLDEVSHYNILGESVANDEQSLERNCQNPDYAPHVICNNCDEEREGAGFDLVTDMGTLSEDIEKLTYYREA